MGATKHEFWTAAGTPGPDLPAKARYILGPGGSLIVSDEQERIIMVFSPNGWSALDFRDDPQTKERKRFFVRHVVNVSG